MRSICTLLILTLGLSSCKSSKHAKHKTSNDSQVIIDAKRALNTYDSKTAEIEYAEEPAKPVEEDNEEKSKADAITHYALQFEGVRYKWGGTTNAGMDCSGLVFESFRAHDIILPRISRDMAKQGDKIPLKKVQEGDLLFFRTQNRRNDINHVGLIITTEDDIQFIHATTRAGVIVSRLSEDYWTDSFVEARRIL
ncbi:C40 family peptidase [Aestuariibaculum suncheonense]|uniref:C40 family peptidase n=1 Tax=Aestuariibaculum suncheonense TaxID=1028745 RepID=A0A8J6Q937_9FLAO|nr:C40 family peptidase [Aestuariibaculum suncheonense]MBD0836314.1 C40 family peptidase [Aestuariibaculum suncheonense]